MDILSCILDHVDHRGILQIHRCSNTLALAALPQMFKKWHLRVFPVSCGRERDIQDLEDYLKDDACRMRGFVRELTIVGHNKNDRYVACDCNQIVQVLSLLPRLKTITLRSLRLHRLSLPVPPSVHNNLDQLENLNLMFMAGNGQLGPLEFTTLKPKWKVIQLHASGALPGPDTPSVMAETLILVYPPNCSHPTADGYSLLPIGTCIRNVTRLEVAVTAHIDMNHLGSVLQTAIGTLMVLKLTFPQVLRE